MKKILAYFLILFLLITGLFYFLVFTQTGNNTLKPFIEEQINSHSPVPVTLDKFTLSLSTIKARLLLPDNSHISLSGDYGLLSSSIDLNYHINIIDLNHYHALTEHPFEGSFSTGGTIKGEKNAVFLRGEGLLEQNGFNYGMDILNQEPQNIFFTLSDAKLDSLLEVATTPPFLEGTLSLHAFIKNPLPEALDGNVTVSLKEGNVRTALIDLNGTILPKITFALDSFIDLKKESLVHNTLFDSNLFRLTLEGIVNHKNQTLVNRYFFRAKELALLEPITKAKHRGTFFTKGTANGTFDHIQVKGISDLLQSSINYTVNLIEGTPKSAKILLKDLKLNSLFHTLYLPSYAKGEVNSKILLDNLDGDKLSGSVNLSAYFSPEYALLQKEMNLSLPKSDYNISLKSNINELYAMNLLTLQSDYLSLHFPSALQIKEKSFDGQYTLTLNDLNKLKPLTKMKLKGDITAEGRIKHEYNSTTATLRSKLFGGEIDAVFKDNKILVKLKDVEFLKILDMLVYPKIFKATADGKLTFDLTNQKGDFYGQLKKGQILHTKNMKNLKRYLGLDLGFEVFNDILLRGIIQSKQVIYDLKMKSAKTSIVSKKSFLDLEERFINSTMQVTYGSTALEVKLKGDIEKPKLKLNTKKLLKDTADDLIKSLF